MADNMQNDKPEEATGQLVTQPPAALLQGLGSQGKCKADEYKSFEELQVAEGQTNPMILACQQCHSKILRAGKATLIAREVFLPLVTQKKSIGTQPDGETVKDFWLVDEMMTFENVGFSNTVGASTKYLTCADCEMGPLGIHDLQNPKEFLVAAKRVKYASC